MSPYTPSSDAIIFALEALGFDVEDENDEYAIMSNGNYSIKVYHDPDEEQIKKLRSGLSEIFSDYESQVEALVVDDEDGYGADDEKFDMDIDFDYRDEVRMLKAWLNRLG